jgi:hypothetical protein
MNVFFKLLPFFVVEYIAYIKCSPIYVTGIFSKNTDVVVNPFSGVYLVFNDDADINYNQDEI